MKKIVLDNGLTVLLERKPLKSATIEVSVNVGSNNENKKIFGISHFIEHMLFEGTKNRTANQLVNAIESKGGEINAATTHDRTFYYTKIPRKHFNTALNIISDIIQNPVFNKKIIEKERQVILSEVDLVMDEPNFYQWFFFLKNLFKKHPARNPTYGTRKTVSKLNQNNLSKFYNEYYVPNNMIITIVGDIKDPIKKIKKLFSFKNKKIPKIKLIIEPKQIKSDKKIEKRPINQSYIILGYKTPPRVNKDTYALDIMRSVLGRGQSGKLFNEIRTKRGLGYSVGVEHQPGKNCGFFAIHVSTDKKNIPKVKSIILTEIKKLNNLTSKELKEAKTFLEGEFILDSEDPQKLANQLSFWQTMKNANEFNKYLSKMRKVTIKDIKRVLNKYFKNHTLTILQQA